jgi:hypothetical protein
MRYLSSRPFLIGLVLVVGAFAVAPLFVTALAEQTCTGATPESPSWDCFQPFRVDFAIPVVMAAAGLALMLATVVRTRRASRN